MRFTRTRAAVTLIGLTVAGVASNAATAGAVTPGQQVAAVSGTAGQVSWHTPAMPSRHVKMTNSATGRDAATIITLADKNAPSSYDFALTLPGKSTASVQPDGSVAVVTAGRPVGAFLPPWAKDANGKALPTHFTVNGATLTQQIDTAGAAYPITADPHYTWGWISGTVYFNKTETRSIAVAGSGAAAFGFPVGGAFSALANIAMLAGKCVKAKWYGGTSITQFGVYGGKEGGGYCR
ncbi:hypothetical protein ACSMXN_19485 [Jatrophihabitans sp. DSM 45814]